MIVNLAIRNFWDGKLQNEEKLAIDESDINTVVIPKLQASARQHLIVPGMMEIEFLDELDPQQRFYRIGTDPRGMVAPIEIALDGEETIH